MEMEIILLFPTPALVGSLYFCVEYLKSLIVFSLFKGSGVQ